MFGFRHSALRTLHFALATLSLLCCTALAQADLFTLQSGGQVEGEWVNRDAPLKQPYRVKTADGLTLLLKRGNVREVVHERRTKSAIAAFRRRLPIRSKINGSWPSGVWRGTCRSSAKRTCCGSSS